MTELMPCPFCGGEDASVASRQHYRYTNKRGWNVLCADCGGGIGLIECGDGIWRGEFETKAKVIEAWNTRSAGTCEVVAFIEHKLFDEPDAVEFSCGHDVMVFGREMIPNYCPECGRKVSA